MYYYKFRYTIHPEQQEAPDKQHIALMKHLVEFLTQYMVVHKYTAGVEQLGKDGQPCLKHIHIHFQSHAKRDTIAKQLVRKFIDESDYRKKSQIYSLKAEPEVDPDKFYRYPLKEQPELNDKLMYSGFTQEEIVKLHETAHSVRKISYEVNQTKRDKKEDITFVEKFCSYLDTTESTDHKSTFLNLAQFYIDHDKPLNHKQIYDYSYLYLAKKKIITLEQFYYLR